MQHGGRQLRGTSHQTIRSSDYSIINITNMESMQQILENILTCLETLKADLAANWKDHERFAKPKESVDLAPYLNPVAASTLSLRYFDTKPEWSNDVVATTKERAKLNVGTTQSVVVVGAVYADGDVRVAKRDPNNSGSEYMMTDLASGSWSFPLIESRFRYDDGEIKEDATAVGSRGIFTGTTTPGRTYKINSRGTMYVRNTGSSHEVGDLVRIVKPGDVWTIYNYNNAAVAIYNDTNTPKLVDISNKGPRNFHLWIFDQFELIPGTAYYADGSSSDYVYETNGIGITGTAAHAALSDFFNVPAIALV